MYLDIVSFLKDYTCVNVIFDIDKTGGILSVVAEKDGIETVLIDLNDNIEKFVRSIMEDFNIEKVENVKLSDGGPQDPYDMIMSFSGESLLFDIVYGDGRFFRLYR